MSISSMTGFGRGSAEGLNVRVEVELSTVNRKQFDLAFTMAQDFFPLESKFRDIIHEKISRGRVQCVVKVAALNAAAGIFNVEALKRMSAAISDISKELNVENNVTLADLLRIYEDAELSLNAFSPDELWPVMEIALDAALKDLTAMRDAEGGALKKDLTSRVGELVKLRESVAVLAVSVPAYYKETLMKRIEELGVEISADDSILAREVAFFADKCDVSEELTRLSTHLSHFVELLESDKPCGRPLDFLCQEIHREINTIGSKANNSAISRIVIDFKAGLEAVREQVQNLE